MSTTLILIRHGETIDNAARTPRGQGQGELTEMGWAQAHSVGERLSRMAFDHLYCSDLNRAVQTASAIAARTGHEPIRKACLRERDFGQFEGIPWAEIAVRFPAELAQYRSGNPDIAPPGGESSRRLQERSVQCLQTLSRQHAGQTIVVVTHGGVIHSLLREVLGIPLETPRRFSAANASTSTFRCRDGDWKLVDFNDTSHLASESPPAVWRFTSEGSAEHHS
ncbi:MAG: histidine phosphatase family protein [Caldilineales bacterium]|nr:histidine phosphatase family protein [Caldilineales bacterium]